MWLQDAAPSIETEDLRRSVEGTQHDHDATVLLQMCNGLDSAPPRVRVDKLPGAGNAQAIEALGRQVDVAVILARCGRNEEHLLVFDEAANPVVNFLIVFSHCEDVPSADCNAANATMKHRVRVSSREARRIALAAHGFDRPRPERADDARHFRRVLEGLGILQLDFVNVLVPAHYLVMWSRLGHYDRERFDRFVYDSGDYTEQWAHEASIVPAEFWPLLEHRRQAWRPWKRNPILKLDDSDAYLDAVMQQVREQGALVAGDLPPVPGPKRKPGDWHRSIPRWALEYHFARGDLGVRRRLKNFQRVYDLPERILATEHRDRSMSRDEAERQMLRRAASALGVATLHDLADYYRMSPRDAAERVAELADAGELIVVDVEGWREPAYVAANARSPRTIDAASLLSPFDPVVWFRPRAERLFDFHYRIEIYVPAAKRRYGYYVLPFLLGEDIVARVDLKADRAAGVLRVQHAYPEDDIDTVATLESLASELRQVADWLGLEEIAVNRHNDFSTQLGKITCPQNRSST